MEIDDVLKIVFSFIQNSSVCKSCLLVNKQWNSNLEWLLKNYGYYKVIFSVIEQKKNELLFNERVQIGRIDYIEKYNQFGKFSGLRNNKRLIMFCTNKKLIQSIEQKKERIIEEGYFKWIVNRDDIINTEQFFEQSTCDMGYLCLGLIVIGIFFIIINLEKINK